MKYYGIYVPHEPLNSFLRMILDNRFSVIHILVTRFLHNSYSEMSNGFVRLLYWAMWIYV